MTIKNILKSTVLVLTLLCSPMLKPVVTEIDVMRNPQTGQNIILIGDIHFDLPDNRISRREQKELLTFLETLNQKSNGSLACCVEDALSWLKFYPHRLRQDKARSSKKEIQRKQHAVKKIVGTVIDGNDKHTNFPNLHGGSPFSDFAQLIASHNINTYNAEECARFEASHSLKAVEQMGEIAARLHKEDQHISQNFWLGQRKSWSQYLLYHALKKLYAQAQSQLNKGIKIGRCTNTGDCMLLDLEMIRIVYEHPQVKHIVLLAGEAHIDHVKKILSKANFKSIEKFYNEKSTFGRFIMFISRTKNKPHLLRYLQLFLFLMKANDIELKPLQFTLATLDLKEILPKVMQLLEQPTAPKQPAVNQLQSKL